MIEQPKPPRENRGSLTCWRCGGELELPATQKSFHCPVCGAVLVIQWRCKPPGTVGKPATNGMDDGSELEKEIDYSANRWRSDDR
jgi:predicted RNA-binding Zn-ribbon protein involved in translation (DUF1610 family)